MQALSGPESPFTWVFYEFSDRQGKVVELHLMTDKSIQVAAISFTKEGWRIPIPEGLTVHILDLNEGVVSLYSSDMDGFISFDTKYQFSVQYFSKLIYAGYAQ